MKLYQLFLVSLFSFILTSCSIQQEEEVNTHLLLAEYLEQNNLSLMENTDNRVDAMMESVKKKQDYKALIPAALDIIETAQKFIKDLEPAMYSLKNDLEQQQIASRRYVFHFLSGAKRKRSPLPYLNIEEKTKQLNNKIIERLELISSNRALGIFPAEIDDLKSELALNKLEIDLNDKTLEESYALLVALKNAALLSSSASVDFLASKTITTTTGWGRGRLFIESSPKTNYIIKGDSFESEIYLSGLVDTHPKVLYLKVNGKELPMKNGFAIYKTSPQAYGEYKYRVEIAVRSPFTGKAENYKKTFKFEVGERCY